MESFASELAKRNFILRSGNATGADLAFATGANKIDPTLVELHLPWKKFNTEHIVDGNKLFVTGFDEEIRKFSAEYHPAWDKCDKHARSLHTRNATIVLGVSLDDPVNFLMCWTKDRTTWGGTGQAIRIADAFGVPIINMTGDGWDVEFSGVIQEIVRYKFGKKN